MQTEIRFKQLVVYDNGGLYGLDEQGKVWCYLLVNTNKYTWRPISMSVESENLKDIPANMYEKEFNK